MSEMYTKHAKQYDAVVKDNIYNALLERPSTMALLDDLSGADVVDMGCGSGVYAEWFIGQSVKHLTCVDASSDMIDLVQTKLGNQVSAYVQDIAKGLPKESDSSADVIVCPLVLHYIEDLTPVFADVHRVLKPSGYIVFSTHHPFADFECSISGNYFEREYIEEEWNTVGTPVKVSFYRRSLMEISEAISASGLKISRITEGSVDEKVKSVCETTYQRLKNNPNFIFFRCEKPSAD
ncbi:SAM-dependent methyltransferase [Vibrio coralliilyticus]|uniref:class I SAM-dependent DNA methyltransferase n=1 Tax=Vibrio coralliilyticus TaxID=190893 RepID=UPI0008108888|nr:class I SAM-dependent methyltransferase [Vibrio coralliilyticus]ANW26827.1 SAM-dependent methyltransferase [Vibrio coralliilyticus]